MLILFFSFSFFVLHELLFFYKLIYFFLNRFISYTGLLFLLSIVFLLFFDKSFSQPQAIIWIYKFLGWFYIKNLWLYGIDGLSIFFIILTTGLIFLCVLEIWNNQNLIFKSKDFIVYLLLLEIFLIISFTTWDIFVFYISFESVLIPMFIIIGIWGSRERKIKANFYFFLYTLVGSILMFFCILILFFESYSTNFFILYSISLILEKEFLLWLCSFLAFSVKIPMFPFHIWLPEAHVEAPTCGSVILAGLLLKLGGYGYIRIVLPLFSYASHYYFPLVSILCALSIFYASFTTIRQVDLKKIIAYSSIAHMNIVLIGIFTCNNYGIQGAIFLMLAHGVVSSALFFIIGVLYIRHGTRLLYYYGGLIFRMPLFSLYLLVFCLANIATPGSCNFVGELLIFVSLMNKNIFILILTTFSVVLSVIYTMWFFNRIVFGNLKILYIKNWSDINKKENFIFFTLLSLTLFFGFFPNFILDTTLSTSMYIIELINFKIILI